MQPRPSSFTIASALSAADLVIVARLFRAYAASLDVDLRFQDFEHEVASLPGRYAPPTGELLLARDGDGVPLGCVASRALEAPDVCEIKRLYVAPEARGRGIGRALVDAIVDAARGLRNREIRLDTLPAMRAAIALYERAGFVRVPAYYDTPIAGTIFFARRL